MNFANFISIVDDVRKNKPIWFAGDSEPLALDGDISAMEERLQIRFPSEYKSFVRQYGGGYFGLTNVFAANDSEEWGIANKNSGLIFDGKFLAVSDDEAGGYYGFVVLNGACSDAVYYFNLGDGQEPQLKFNSFIDYLLEIGLNLPPN